MGAPLGNRFWENRSKHGRDKLFATPELLWEAACEYFEWCEENPWLKNEAIKSGERTGVLIPIPTARPYTITGLCLYLDCNTQYFNQFKKNLKDSDKDFSLVITRIEEIIYTQKFEGAAVGAFNPNIIARDLGLSDNVNNKNTNINYNSAEMPAEEVKRYSEILEDEV